MVWPEQVEGSSQRLILGQLLELGIGLVVLAGPVRVGRARVSTVRGVRVVCTALVVPMTPTESGAVATLPSLRRPVCACECLNIADVRADSYGRGAGGGACTA